MIYKADVSVINYLISCKTTGREDSYKESAKEEGNFILIDYFDWLDYVTKTDNHFITKYDLLWYTELKKTCNDIINILRRPLTADSINRLVELNTFSESKNNVYVRKIDQLCVGYKNFVEEMLVLQDFFIKTYGYNNSTYPILIVPFSFGLNRISSGHFRIYEDLSEDGGMDGDVLIKVERGYLKDACQRPFVDFKIYTYTYERQEVSEPYNLPLNWQISASIEKRSARIASKIKYVGDCYSQYCYTGYNDEMTPYLENYTPEQKKQETIFLLNYPFLLKTMRLAPNIQNGIDKNTVEFIK